ncbi:acetoacetate--CoA ligase [Pseudomonas sp. NBRC 100443]|uniref:acetoacetate--CoA ligase n=1 Tax=Pseudomonas sp. NBRC 100443 TaxID=1113665 RepID=UPI0024A47749|nr:acetoacetate--CoA ligase [Pseudomonas sp. NBRC 100443]GLU37342.1 acetoacetate-CoA ligase [Pseudomonas sp. NBRC 100443]
MQRPSKQFTDGPLWAPSEERLARSRLAAFSARAEALGAPRGGDFHALQRWSVEQAETFWSELWNFCGVIGERGERVLLDAERMPGARWFPDARLNFAENLLREGENPEALVFWGEDKVKRRMSRAQLRLAVQQLAGGLRKLGIQPGDRVAAYLPNVPETLIAMLAAASLGAIFTSASPDFGPQGVLDRFGQCQPRVLLVCDGYWYNGKAVDCLGKLGEIVAGLPSVELTLLVPYLGTPHDAAVLGIPAARDFDDFLAEHADAGPLQFQRLAFDHPLYILYSSGTTGVPKCIVHGVGGTLLQHLKEHYLQWGIDAGDRLFYFTTCGWTMWNCLVSALASDVTLMLYDGSPFVADGRVLWEYAQAERITHFGTSAKFIDAQAKAGLHPGRDYDLGALRVLLSTGSPLSPEGFDYVYASIGSDLQLSSISGGTDIVSAFVGAAPSLPVWRGEIQAAGLGMAVEVWDEEGRPVRQQKGELVCVKSFPCMPVGFWNDADGSKYRAAYFERFPGVWCHGDFCEITEHGGWVVYGRSDATLNPGGVRIGTAEIYRQVEKLPEVLESIVIGQAWPPEAPSDVRVVLFVRLQDGVELDEALVQRIRQTVRENTTPRHVPARVLQVADIPRTKSGKIVELAVRNVVHGEPVKNIEALANPQALELFRNRPELVG